ncbi:MAG: cupin domain-containing protein [Halieaceae bacterium]|jgi:mannose-6-phosphate isomerase-like protein (cupin superfamily)|nr:cupin domain-containing protein [Halieaceae bacterium]
MPALPSVVRPEQLSAKRISPTDTNYFALLVDPIDTPPECLLVVEIYEPRGKTPPNVHQQAYEFFFILKGRGRAFSGDVEIPLSTGDFLTVPPGGEHVVENLTDEKLYALCLMQPNEGFAELIRAGEDVPLTDEDIAVLRGE